MSKAEIKITWKRRTPKKTPVKFLSPTAAGSKKSGSESSAVTGAISDAEYASKEIEAQFKSIGFSLRNFFKLSKAYNWAMAEWFYSDIDKVLLDCKSEFIKLVKELAPRLDTTKLSRYEWTNLRRRLGPPRRCSQAFFYEERCNLERKRQLIRTAQSGMQVKIIDMMQLAALPEQIPMILPVGTKVTARLRKPEDGIFAGTVISYDAKYAEYQVAFMRLALGTQLIPDFEIMSENFHGMLRLERIEFKLPAQKKPLDIKRSIENKIKLDLINHIVVLENLIHMKDVELQRLSKLNTVLGAKMFSQMSTVSFQSIIYKNYAPILFSLKQLNGKLKYELTRVRELSILLAEKPNIKNMNALWLKECHAKSSQMVDKMNKSLLVSSPPIVILLKNLITLLVFTQNLDSDWKSEEMKKVLSNAIEKVRSNLVYSSKNDSLLRHIQLQLEHIALKVINKGETQTAEETDTKKGTDEDKENNKKYV